MRTITGCRYKTLKMEDFSLDWWDSWYRAAVPFQLMISGVVFFTSSTRDQTQDDKLTTTTRTERSLQFAQYRTLE